MPPRMPPGTSLACAQAGALAQGTRFSACSCVLTLRFPIVLIPGAYLHMAAKLAQGKCWVGPSWRRASSRAEELQRGPRAYRAYRVHMKKSQVEVCRALQSEAVFCLHQLLQLSSGSALDVDTVLRSGMGQSCPAVGRRRVSRGAAQHSSFQCCSLDSSSHCFFLARRNGAGGQNGQGEGER